MSNVLNFVGTGSAFNPAMGNTSAWFTCEERLFVIDCGASVFQHLWELQEIRNYDDIYVIITQLPLTYPSALKLYRLNT